ncbi:hypothetical protein HZC32_01550 [Candidatus Woesearchaeota archaeon]|nr:hypothetical protein [Candidatus Woesearchaeota archaeon]
MDKEKIGIIYEDKVRKETPLEEALEEGATMVFLEKGQTLQEEEKLGLEEKFPEYRAMTIDFNGNLTDCVLRKELIYYLHEHSEDSYHSLDVLMDGWQAAERFESELIKKGETHPEAAVIQHILGGYSDDLANRLMKFPEKEANQEFLQKAGFYDSDITEKLTSMAGIMLGSETGIVLMGQGETNLAEKIETVTMEGLSTGVVVGAQICKGHSHHEIKPIFKEVQRKCTRELTLDREYQLLEDQVVDKVSEKLGTREHTRNLVRMYLNLSCLYDHGVALPILPEK